jgi:tetratricopeptide (TPR) repeat protein
VTSGHFRQLGIKVAVCVLVVATSLLSTRAQSPEAAGAVVVQGHVRDSDGKPLANAIVFLQPATGPAHTAHTDSEGAYRLAARPAGVYTVRAELTGYNPAVVGPVSLAESETKQIDLALVSERASARQNSATGTASEKSSTKAPEFFDEPKFTVAGVTQATNSGGHGSDTVLRTTEALARATVSLTKEPSTESEQPSRAIESSLRDAVARDPNDPAPHHRLAGVEEKLGKPLEAVREYQRAAELDPSEPNLFDWGAELLEHRALEPATEVFTKGNHLFPKSVRMLVALGVAWYARGSYDQATQCLANASDLAPDNPTPYLFLGKMQSVKTAPSPESVERLARFARLNPDNALANYYYAVGLQKQAQQSSGTADGDAELSERIESLLQKVVRLDPKLGAAYLQLGILFSQRAKFSQAISEYRKAIETSSELDETLTEAHYRLAQAYVRTGDKTKAQEELQLHDRLAKKIKEDSARERREIQEFVISLRK